MHVRITNTGFSVELSPGEAQALIEQLGEVPAKGRPKVRQLHHDLEHALTWQARGAVGHGR
jgi:hypothetical protein